MSKSKFKLILAMLIFGSIGLFVKRIHLSSAQIALARAVIGSFSLLVSILIVRQKMNWGNIRKNLPFLLGSGMIFGFNWMFLFKSYQYTTIANATLSYYCAPLLVMLLSPVILKERLTLPKVFCMLAAMTGMFCIVGAGGEKGTSHFLGIAYGLAAAGLYAGVMLINKFLKGLKAVESTFCQLFITSIALLPYVLLSENLQFTALGTSGWILLVIVGVIHTGAAFILFFSSIQELEGQIIAIFSYIDPISAIVMSSLLLHEKMTGLQILGGLLITGAAFGGDFIGKTQPPPAEAGGFFGRLKSAKEPGNSNPEAIVKLKHSAKAEGLNPRC
jgi:RarD protein